MVEFDIYKTGIKDKDNRLKTFSIVSTSSSALPFSFFMKDMSYVRREEYGFSCHCVRSLSKKFIDIWNSIRSLGSINSVYGISELNHVKESHESEY